MTHVGAREQQHQRDGSDQQSESRTSARRHRVRRADHAGGPARVGLRVLGVEPARHQVELGGGVRGGSTVPETTDDVVAPLRAADEVRGADRERRPQRDGGIVREPEAVRHDSDDLERLSV